MASDVAAGKYAGARQAPAGRPKVTVMIITYNHARYIAQAIDSVLAQQVDFPLAIHVIDDCSTDGAQDIIRDYAARHPGVVKPFINRKNIGRKVTQRNFYRGFKTLDGDYIAILEGDDYWSWPHRLQTHIDFLDANPDFVACANNTLTVYEDGSKPSHLFLEPSRKKDHDLKDVISLQSFFHASAITFRNVFRGRVPRYFRSPLSCEVFITIAHAQYGKIRAFPQPWSVYRQHSGGLFSQMNPLKGWLWNIEGLRACNRWLGYRHYPHFAQSIVSYCHHVLDNGAEHGLTAAQRRRTEAILRRHRVLVRTWRSVELALLRLRPRALAGTVEAGPVKLNLGCGFERYVDCINVDIRAEVSPDLVVDLRKTPWPWPDNYADEVRLIRTLERLGRDVDDFQAIMRELYRVSRDGARIGIRATHHRHTAFVEDPTCVRAITPGVLSLFDRTKPPPWVGSMSLAKPNGVDFEIVRETLTIDKAFRQRIESGQIPPHEVERMKRHEPDFYREHMIELRVHKPPRQDSTP